MQNIITDGNKKYLYDLTAERALKDYRKANYKPFTKSGRSTQVKPYSLSDNTLEALEMYKTALKPEICADEIEMIKAYILKNILHPEEQ